MPLNNQHCARCCISSLSLQLGWCKTEFTYKRLDDHKRWVETKAVPGLLKAKKNVKVLDHLALNYRKGTLLWDEKLQQPFPKKVQSRVDSYSLKDGQEDSGEISAKVQVAVTFLVWSDKVDPLWLRLSRCFMGRGRLGHKLTDGANKSF